MKKMKTFFEYIQEEAPANATGPAVPGTGDTGEAFVSKSAQEKHIKRNKTEKTSSILRRLLPQNVGQ